MRLAQIVLILTIIVTTLLIWAEHQIKIIH
jgi:hypothetical protein